MLSLLSHGTYRDCQRVTRRDLLKIGTLGLTGLTLGDLLQVRKLAADEGNPLKDRSVVMLFLQGGPTHIETFDPKMTAPSEYRSMFGEVSTSLPGVTIGGTFPRMAKLAHRMAIVRSFRHGNGSHATASKLVSSGGNPTGANLGSLYARLAGSNNPATGMPTNALLNPAAVGDEYKKLYTNTGRIGDVGSLGKAYQAFDPSAGGEVKQNMELRIERDRLDDRRSLMRSLDRLKQQAEASDVQASYDRFNQQAFDVILGGAAKAFDLSEEDPRTLEMYDTGEFTIPKAVIKKKRDTTPKFSPVALGKQMLLARRLCEAGCGYVTVSSSGWDMHGNAFGIDDGMACLGPAVDKAVSAFLTDLEQRGLSDKILLVITGEFGRTPKINKKAGRDHWGNLCTLALAGGGLEMGQVIGQSDRTASVPASDPIGPDHLMSTIMHSLFDLGTLRVVRGVPREILSSVEGGQPIPQLI